MQRIELFLNLHNHFVNGFKTKVCHHFYFLLTFISYRSLKGRHDLCAILKQKANNNEDNIKRNLLKKKEKREEQLLNIKNNK
jgi:hypothetical protein